MEANRTKVRQNNLSDFLDVIRPPGPTFTYFPQNATTRQRGALEFVSSSDRWSKAGRRTGRNAAVPMPTSFRSGRCDINGRLSSPLISEKKGGNARRNNGEPEMFFLGMEGRLTESSAGSITRLPLLGRPTVQRRSTPPDH